MTTVGKTYSLEGRMLADCSCNPCTCSPCGCASYDSFVAYHIERGKIKGIDVSNVTFAKFIYNQSNGGVALVYVTLALASRPTPANLRRYLTDGWRIPVQPVKGELSAAVPTSHELPDAVLSARVASGLELGQSSWLVLSGLLLGTDVGNVCRRCGESCLDDGIDRSNAN